MAEVEGVFTRIDAFVKYLNEHGETESSVIAAALGVTEKNVQDWANILEKSRSAKITYKLGKMFIAPVAGQGRGTAEAKQTVEIKKEIVGADITSQIADLSKLNQRIDELNKFVAASEDVLKKNGTRIKGALDRINSLQNEVATSFNKIKSRKDEIENFSTQLDSMLAKISSSAESSTAITTNSGNVKAVIDDIRAKIKSFEESNDLMLANYDRQIAEQRQRLIKASGGVKKEINSLRNILSDEEKNMAEYENTIRTYKTDSATIKRRVDQNKAEIFDIVAKTRSEIEARYVAAQAEAQRVNEILSKAKEGLLGFENLTKKLEDIKKELSDASKENAEIRTELDSISQQLKVIEASAKTPERSDLIEKVDKQTKSTSDRIRKTFEQVGDVKSKVDEFSK